MINNWIEPVNRYREFFDCIRLSVITLIRMPLVAPVSRHSNA